MDLLKKLPETLSIPELQHLIEKYPEDPKQEMWKRYLQTKRLNQATRY